MTRIFCIHPGVNDVESFLRFAKLGDIGRLVWDDKSPDILIATEWIYYRKAYFRKFRELYGKSGIKVALLGEAVEGDYTEMYRNRFFEGGFPFDHWIFSR